MSELTPLFSFDAETPRFEELAHANGGTYWKEADLREGFGYADHESFRRVIKRAMQACLTLDIMVDEVFVRDGNSDYKVTRFGCYLIAMNGDASSKPQVAAAQVYFAQLAATYETCLEHEDGINRLVIREEVKTGEKSLSGTAQKHGVVNHANFKNAGYMGMYNMSLKQLKRFKNLGEKATIADHMGREELAAHLFRITQTEARIRNRNVKGQSALEDTAKTVGRKVRAMVIDNTGSQPEMLPPAEKISKVRSKIKKSSKQLGKLDK